MTITKEDTKKIAKLARLDISGQEEEFTEQLNDILGMVEQLQEVNTEGVEPMTSVAPMKLPMREDKITDGNIREEVLQNAPKQEFGCFAVPKVIE